MEREHNWDLIYAIRLLQFRIGQILLQHNLDFALLSEGQRKVVFIVFDPSLNTLLDRWDAVAVNSGTSIFLERVIADRVIALNRMWDEN